MKYERYKYAYYTYSVKIEGNDLLYDTRGEYRLNIYSDGKYMQTYKYYGLEDIQQKSPHVMYPVAVALKELANKDMKNKDMLSDKIEGELKV